MPEHPDKAAVQRRANRVGLRTLRQRPKVVDQTVTGSPIYEVRSVRLLLPENASHFSRLEKCARCGRNVRGAPVFKPADLDQLTPSMVCRDCVRSVAISPDPYPANRPMEPDPAPPQVKKEPVGEAVVAAAPDDGRLAAVEAQLQAVTARLADLAAGQQSESTERRRADDAMQSRLNAAMVRGLDELQAQVKEALEAGAGRAAALEDHVRRSGAPVADRLQGQQRELAELSGALAETRSQLHRLIDLEEQRPDQAAVERRIEDALATLARSIEAHRAEVTQRLDALGQKVREAEARVDALAVAADAGAGRLQALEQGVRETVDRLTGLVEARLEERWTVTSARGPVPGGLLVDTERELQAAQNRLAQVLSTRYPG